jgi:hypothetical protein
VRCRTTALIIRVQIGESEDFFANQAQAALPSPLDIMQEGG